MRLTVLVATVAAFLLVPVAQAAADTIKVNIAGTGSGDVMGLLYGPGSPEVECSGPPATGTCESSYGEFIAIGAQPDPGSEFTGWTIEKGSAAFLCDGSEAEKELAEEYEDEKTSEISGACFVEGAESEVTVTFEAEAAKVPLTVNKAGGTGSGTVISNPAGIECGATCTAEFNEGEKVTLTASPDSESLFVSWKGCETGGAIGRTCKVTMDKAKTVTAKFTKAYDVSVTNEGSGKVSSSPGGVLCLTNCSATSAAFKELTAVTLTAAPAKHFVFDEWTGDCSGESLTCPLGSLGEDKEVGAKFTEVPKHLLTLTKTGGGNGAVKAKQYGINCGATCSTQAAAYYQGEVVELLVPVPGKGSTFGGWSGSGCSGTGTCLVTMSSAKSVNAEFK